MSERIKLADELHRKGYSCSSRRLKALDLVWAQWTAYAAR